MKANILYTITTKNGALAHFGAELTGEGQIAVVPNADIMETLRANSSNGVVITSASTVDMPVIGDGLDEIRKESMINMIKNSTPAQTLVDANTLYTITKADGTFEHLSVALGNDGEAFIETASYLAQLTAASGDNKYIVSATTVNMPVIGDGLDEIRKDAMQLIIDKALSTEPTVAPTVVEQTQEEAVSEEGETDADVEEEPDDDSPVEEPVEDEE